MTNKRRQYTIKDFQDKEVIADLLSRFGASYHFDSVDTDINKIATCPVKAANLWNAFTTFVGRALHEKYHPSENRKENKKTRIKIFSEFFSEDLLVMIMCHTDKYHDRDTEQLCKDAYPELALIEAIGLMGHQLYYDKNSGEQTKRIFEILTTLPQPFDDNRFEAIPIHTCGYRRGMVHSLWLKDIEGHYQRKLDRETQQAYVKKLETAFDYLFMDAKIGVLFTFKGKPSIRVCFNIDKDNNVYIHQIQAFLKDRGHYKLSDWRQTCVDYVKALFPDSRIYVVTGETAANDTLSSYSKDVPDSLKPSEETLAKIRLAYDQIKGLPVKRKKLYSQVLKRVA